LKNVGGLSNEELQKTFAGWNKGPLQSFLMEITGEVFLKKDEKSANLLVDMILDKAKQKGTGMWTSQSAMDLNIPIPTVDAAVSMRYLSAIKEERVAAAKKYSETGSATNTDKSALIDTCKNALEFAWILSYAQGLELLCAASDTYKYEIDIAEVLRIWKGGCIIRSAILNELRQAYISDSTLKNIILSDVFVPRLSETRNAASALCGLAMNAGTPIAAFAASLNYFDAYKTARLPANLIQAQRDLFGAHTYERTDASGSFHTDWK
ncbi:MAG TPA: hypothetical protein VKH37_01875, partial [Ferruginibacter sp.]|nr:hypothetical protein [Ferruginibacter sp.]